jgi:two-component system response regulator AtoC
MRPAVELQSLVDRHEHPFLVIDENFQIVSVNRAFEREFAILRSTVIGKPCCAISHAADRPCYEQGEDFPYQQVLGKNHVHTCFHTHYDNNGRARRIIISVYPLRGPAGAFYLGKALQSTPFQNLAIGDTPILGASPAFIHAMERLELAAQFDTPVHLQGETGTGKELAARYIHERSIQRHHPAAHQPCGNHGRRRTTCRLAELRLLRRG